MFRSLLPSGRRELARADEPFAALQRNINRMFDDTFRAWPTFAGKDVGSVVPSMDVKETDTAFEVTVELPGVEQKDLQVTYANGDLTIKGEKKSEKTESKEGYQLSERSYGSFLRSLSIDEVDADKIEAGFGNGVLKVTLPKAPSARAKAKTITIKSSK